MKKHLFLVLASALMFCFTSCGNEPDAGGANLFIQKSSLDEYALYCVKFLSPGDNASNGTNVYGKCLGIQTIGGKEFYAFKAPRKELDIYVEAYAPGAYGGFTNDRESVNLKINDWAKLVYWTEPGYGCDYRVMDGSGPVY
ncbi:MAG: hypothetical protein MJZ82_02275 [Paludibacteraceae bacterium]|nr:hypothetical protein [Paludibacteraceae bacterium]